MWELALILGFVGIAGVLTYLSIKLDEEHFFLKLLFLFITMITFIIALSTIKELVLINSILIPVNAIYFISLILVILMFIYFTIWFIYNAIKDKKSKELYDLTGEYEES